MSSSSSIQATSQISRHKVTAPKGVLQEDGRDIILLHDYGSFGLYDVTQDKWQQLPDYVRLRASLADDMDLILFDRNSFDTRQSILPQPEFLESYDAEALHLIQFVGPIKDEWLAAVQAAGAELVHYVANNGYLVWTGSSTRQELGSLVETSDFLQFSAPYLPSFKLGPTLSGQQITDETADELVVVTVQMFRHDGKGQSEEILKQLFVEVLSPWEPVLKYQNIVGKIHNQDIPVISQLPDVVWIGEQFPRQLTDEVQAQIIAHNHTAEQATPSGPGYLSWLSSYGFSTDPNSYPIVDVTDDGIGNGLASQAAGDMTLRELGDVTRPSRLSYIANCTSSLDGSGPDGHGHINVSIAGGYDDHLGFPYQDTNGFQNALGINPFGRFAGTRVFDDAFNVAGCGGTDSSLIRETYNRGARIVSNSWGCSSCMGTYDLASQSYDAGVRDADALTPGNQELFILFSAGNSGPGADTIGTPANGKNVLTVGASESVRPTWTDGCGKGPEEADNFQDIANFSSRGPAPGGRVKPDLVAPGTHILGTASTTLEYNGSRVCNKYYPDQQLILAASSGTSHSTPAVAGLASLAYSYLQQNHVLEPPSPALLKGFLIAHTSYLTGVGAADNLPSYSQGFGLPNMTSAFDSTPRIIVEQSLDTLLDQSGDTWSLKASVADPSQPVRIVLAYTDQPGAVGTEPQVNNLDLAVHVDGGVYVGNHIEGQWSVPGGSNDKSNNIEAVLLPSVRDTALQIVVTAFNIAGDGVPGIGDDTDQDFTIVCTNCLQQEDFAMSVQPPVNSLCKLGDATYVVSLKTIMDFAEPVTLEALNPPPGVATRFSTKNLVPPGQSILTLTTSEAAEAGFYEITVAGQSETRQHSTLLNFNLFSEEPSIPVLLQPSDNAFDLPLDIRLSWEPASQGSTYDVQVATDYNFDQIVDSATGLIEPAFTPENLLSRQKYFWRVRAQNDCGAGSFSGSRSFITVPLPGECPYGVTPLEIYSNDFESASPLDGWTHSGSNDTWTISESRSHSGRYAYYAEDIETFSDQVLTSPPIPLPRNIEAVTLSFWNYQAIESSQMAGGTCFDGAILGISTDLGETLWQLSEEPGDRSVLLTDPYDGRVSDSAGNQLGGLAAWCGDPQDWLNSLIRLNAFKGRTVRFMFRLGTDQSEGYIDDGWHIDDIRVQACPLTTDYKMYFPFWSFGS